MKTLFAGISKYLSGKGQQQSNSRSQQPLPSESILRQHIPPSISARSSIATQRSSHLPLTPPWQAVSPKSFPEVAPYNNGGSAHPSGEFPDFNQLPTEQRSILRTFLTTGVRQGLLDFSSLPRCPSWLEAPQPEARAPPQMGPNFDLQPGSHSHQLRDLERRHSQASQQMIDLDRQHSRASQSGSMFPQSSYNSFSTMQMDSGEENVLSADCC